jgi:hypothetical protein
MDEEPGLVAFHSPKPSSTLPVAPDIVRAESASNQQKPKKFKKSKAQTRIIIPFTLTKKQKNQTKKNRYAHIGEVKDVDTVPSLDDHVALLEKLHLAQLRAREGERGPL